jgi:hypothetical protein
VAAEDETAPSYLILLAAGHASNSLPQSLESHTKYIDEVELSALAGTLTRTTDGDNASTVNATGAAETLEPRKNTMTNAATKAEPKTRVKNRGKAKFIPITYSFLFVLFYHITISKTRRSGRR